MNSLQKEGFNLTGTGHVLMTTAKELFLVIVKYFIDFGNKRFLPLVPSPRIKVIAFLKFLFDYLNFSKRRKDVSTGLKIMSRAPKFKDIRKVFPFDKIEFLAKRLRD